MNTLAAKDLTYDLLKKHGLNNWGVTFDQSLRRFGLCDYSRKMISLSAPLVTRNEREAVLDTILHEIAHALTPGHHHDAVWVAKAKEIGANGKRCYSSQDVEVVPLAYKGVCPSCGNVTYRSRPLPPGRNTSCGKCDNKFNPNFIVTYYKDITR